MKELTKIGLFGGTFAPPHKGHVNALHAMLDTIELDKVLVMPNFMPPHKQKLSVDTPKERYDMCLAAFGGIDKVTVSDFEIKKGGLSYTVETLRSLRETYPDSEIYMLCGTDMFLTLDKWFQSEEIFRLANIVCVPRFCDDADDIARKKLEYEKTHDARIVLTETQPLVISSTDIRDCISRGGNENELRRYLPDGVIDIIKKSRLYSACGGEHNG